MIQEQQQVRRFMHKAGQDCPITPCIPDAATINFRYRLIREENLEYINAATSGNLIEVADAIADLLVVVLGAAVSHGINIDPIFQEVCRSNETKFIDGYRSDGKDGNPVGKWIKGKSYSPANIKPLIEDQIALTL